MKRPSFPFYPGDWLKDLNLRQCSVGARGVWIDLMCLMNQGVPYGHLTNPRGEPLSLPFVAGEVKVPMKLLKGYLLELDDNEVCSRTANGVIYSRRMVRDEEKRVARAEGGYKSLTHPNTPKRKGTLEGYAEGYHLSKTSDPPFQQEEEKEESSFQKNSSNSLRSENGKPPYDPTAGWVWFRSEYPKHRINKHLDLQVWISVVVSQAIEDRIREQLPKFKRSRQWVKSSGEFVPQAGKFLGERIFEMDSGPEGASETPATSARKEWKQAL